MSTYVFVAAHGVRAEQEWQSAVAQEQENADGHQLWFSAIKWATILFLINEKAKLLLLPV